MDSVSQISANGRNGYQRAGAVGFVLVQRVFGTHKPIVMGSGDLAAFQETGQPELISSQRSRLGAL
jgi:hypothetical protein